MATDLVGTGLPWVEAIAGSFAPISFSAFHTVDLPQKVKARGHLVAADLDGVPAVGFRIEDGTAYTWQMTPSGVQAVAGSTGASTLIELSEATFSEFLHDLLSASGSVRTGRATVVHGDLATWQRWEPAIRSVLTGREIYGPHVWGSLLDRRGKPLDLQAHFRPDDDPADMQHFLAVAG
jgi:hypothetical protein